jgi:predicted N-acyltransferase
VVDGVGSITERDAWTAGRQRYNPFVSHLTAMEDSGSVGPGTGWDPAPIIVEDNAAN